MRIRGGKKVGHYGLAINYFPRLFWSMESQCLGTTHWSRRVVKLLPLGKLKCFNFFYKEILKIKDRIQKRFIEHPTFPTDVPGQARSRAAWV